MKNRLKELAEEFNMSSYDFQDELGLSRNVISNIYISRSTIDNIKLVALCEYFQVSLEYFLCLSNDGIYVDVLGQKCSLSKEKFLLYKSMNKITYINKKRTLDIHSLDEIKFVNSKVPSIELVNEL